jgi:surfeit locus 1 family protein
MTDALASPTRSRPRWMSWVFALVMLALTGLFLELGKWQLDRLAWKEGLIAQAATNMKLPPTPLPPASQWPSLDPQTFQYRPVTVTGHYLPDEEVRVFYGLSEEAKGAYSGAGSWLMTPFAIDGGGTVFVDRGFVPQNLPAGAVVAAPPAGTLSISGVAVASEEPDFFTPAPDKASRMDWVRNTGRLATMLPPSSAPIAPVYIDLPAGPRGALPQGGETDVTFPNNHLGYAYTWFGFALTTLIMLAEWVRRQWTKGGADTP